MVVMDIMVIGHHGHHAHHGAGVLHQGVRPVHPLPLGDVPRVGGPPARHAQRLLQLPHLLLRLLPLQDSPHQGVWNNLTILVNIIFKKNISHCFPEFKGWRLMLCARDCNS